MEPPAARKRDHVTEPREPEVTALQLSLLISLLTGTETTLLLLQMERDPAALHVDDATVHASETEVLEALRDLERRGLVVSEAWEGRDHPLPGTNIPEYELQRPRIVWWQVTSAGEDVARPAADRMLANQGRDRATSRWGQARDREPEGDAEGEDT